VCHDKKHWESPNENDRQSVSRGRRSSACVGRSADRASEWFSANGALSEMVGQWRRCAHVCRQVCNLSFTHDSDRTRPPPAFTSNLIVEHAYQLITFRHNKHPTYHARCQPTWLSSDPRTTVQTPLRLSRRPLRFSHKGWPQRGE